MTGENNITRQEVIIELDRYGIRGSHVYLIDTIPWIEMIWVDRKIQDIEIAIFNYYLNQHIEKINDAADQQVVTLEEAQAFCLPFLNEPPNPEYLRAVREFIPSIRLSSPDPKENKAAWKFIISGCIDIASGAVTQYPYELTGRFNAAEKECLFDILETLRY